VCKRDRFDYGFRLRRRASAKAVCASSILPASAEAAASCEGSLRKTGINRPVDQVDRDVEMAEAHFGVGVAARLKSSRELGSWGLETRHDRAEIF
jgi:hypothetical protein